MSWSGSRRLLPPMSTSPPRRWQAQQPRRRPIRRRAIAASYVAPDTPEVAAAAELVAMPFFADTKPVADASAAEAEPRSVVLAALTDPVEILPPEVPPAQAPAASAPDMPSQDAATTTGRIELVGECLVAEACIDQFLWALYQRTPKEDTIKEREQRKVTVKRKGKTGDRHQDLHQAGRERFHLEGSQGGRTRRHVDDGLRDRRHGSQLQAEAVSHALRRRGGRTAARHHQRVSRRLPSRLSPAA